MKLDLQHIALRRQHDFQNTPNNRIDEQTLVKLIVALMLSQVQQALGGDVGNDKVGGVDGAAGAKGSQGAQGLGGSDGGQAPQSILTQFVDLLKLLDKLMNNPANQGSHGAKANDPAQALAEAIQQALGGDATQGASGADAAGGTDGADGTGGTDGATETTGADGVNGTDPNLASAGDIGPGNALVELLALLERLTHSGKNEGSQSGGHAASGSQGGSHGAHGSHGAEGAGAPQGGPATGGGTPDAGKSGGTAPTTGTAPAGGTTPTGGATETTAASGALPTGKIPAPTGEKEVNQTIVVKAGEVFDGKGMLFKAGKALGDGGQSESQKPILEVEPGGAVINTQVQGADGIHFKGSEKLGLSKPNPATDFKLTNVINRDVGEDAFTLKGGGHIKVEGGGAFNAADKVFQLNGPGSLSINNFTADNFGKGVRTNGGKDFPMEINITNSKFTNGKEAVVRSDATQAKIALHNVDFSGTKFDVIAPKAAQVEGATQRGWKDFTG